MDPIILELDQVDAWNVMEQLRIAARVPGNDGAARDDALVIADCIAAEFLARDPTMTRAALLLADGEFE